MWEITKIKEKAKSRSIVKLIHIVLLDIVHKPCFYNKGKAG